MYAPYNKMLYNKSTEEAQMEEKIVTLGKHPLTEEIVLTAIDTLFYFEFSDKFKDHMESHPAWEMVYVDRGRCTVVADDRRFSLEQGEMYFHKPHEAHMLEIPSGEFPNILVCSFHCDSPALLHLKEKKLRASAPSRGTLPRSLTRQRAPLIFQTIAILRSRAFFSKAKIACSAVSKASFCGLP